MAISETKDGSEVYEVTDLVTSTSRAYHGGVMEEPDDAYLRAPKLSRFYRGVLFQMILFGA
jgi:hypothetical protein